MSEVDIAKTEAKIAKLTDKRNAIQDEINSLKDTLIKPKLQNLMDSARLMGHRDVADELGTLYRSGLIKWPKDATRNLLRQHDIPFRMDEEGEHDTLRGYCYTKRDLYLATFS